MGNLILRGLQMLTFFLDILVDALYETLSLFPYLYLTYLLMEYLEHQMNRRSMIYIRKAKEYGPIVGGFLGLIPQCGFSIASANLYATGLVTLGTLFAVFLSTSDEMLPLLISGGIGGQLIMQILCIKVFFSIVSGFLIDRFLPNSFIRKKNDPDISAFCKHEKCKCDGKENIWHAAFIHTQKISLLIFFFSLVVNLAFAFGGMETINDALTGIPFLSKFIAALVGLIPSCYPSVFLTQLYLAGTISLGTMMAGTLSNAGLGFLVLYKVNLNQQENTKILALLYGIGVCGGIISEILF